MKRPSPHSFSQPPTPKRRKLTHSNPFSTHLALHNVSPLPPPSPLSRFIPQTQPVAKYSARERDGGAGDVGGGGGKEGEGEGEGERTVWGTEYSPDAMRAYELEIASRGCVFDLDDLTDEDEDEDETLDEGEDVGERGMGLVRGEDGEEKEQREDLFDGRDGVGREREVEERPGDEEENGEVNWDEVPIVQAICCTGAPVVWTEKMREELEWAACHFLSDLDSDSDT